MAVLTRFRRWLLELLVALDQFAHVLFGAPKYLLFGGPIPSADETISSKVGRQAIRGRRWALLAEPFINAPFRLLGDRDHCRSCIEFDELPEFLRQELGGAKSDRGSS